MTNHQTPAFVPQGGTLRRQANNQIITKVPITETKNVEFLV
jgi:hypothetical protein